MRPLPLQDWPDLVEIRERPKRPVIDQDQVESKSGTNWITPTLALHRFKFLGESEAEGIVDLSDGRILKAFRHEGPVSLDLISCPQFVGLGAGEGCRIISMPETEVLLYCRAGHPLDGHPAVGPAEFFSYPTVGPVLPIEAQAWLREHHPENLAQEALSLECSHHALLKKVVAKTDAISGAPGYVIADELSRGELVVLETVMKPMITQAVLVKLKRRNLTPAAMELIALLRTAR